MPTTILTGKRNGNTTAIVKGLITSVPILHLNLKIEWFDMIASGEKKEEYREIKEFYDRVFRMKGIKIKGKYERISDILVCFSNGYAKDRRQMFFRLDRIAKREGNPEWGAIPGCRYYCLVLGEKVWQGRMNELYDGSDVPF